MSNVVLTSELELGFNLDRAEKKINAVTASALLVVSPDSPDEFNLQVYGIMFGAFYVNWSFKERQRMIKNDKE